MSRPDQIPHGAPAPAGESFDREIDVRGIVQVGVWLAVISVVSGIVVFFYYRSLVDAERRALDARPSPLAEANAPRRPPGPQLQARPEGELAAFRAAEATRLASWGWVDRGRGIAHVPVERAIESVVADGLPDFTLPREAPAP
jgi:hypothetical protein